MYPVVYLLLWTLPTAIRIYQTLKHAPSPFALQTVDKVGKILTTPPTNTDTSLQACIVSQGIVDAVIYGINEASLSRWRELIFPTSNTVVASSGTSLTTRGTLRRDTEIPDQKLLSVNGVSSATGSTTTTISNSTNTETSSIDKKAGVELTVLPRVAKPNRPISNSMYK
jgi:hypothetical protein